MTSSVCSVAHYSAISIYSVESYAFKVPQNDQVAQLLRSPERDAVEVPLGLTKSFMAVPSEEIGDLSLLPY